MDLFSLFGLLADEIAPFRAADNEPAETSVAEVKDAVADTSADLPAAPAQTSAARTTTRRGGLLPVTACSSTLEPSSPCSNSAAWSCGCREDSLT